VEISGKTAVFGLIGSPVSHSLSPLIHGRFADSTGVDSVFVAFDTYKSDLSHAISGAQALGISGLSVTAPHKIAVMNFLDRLDKTAAATGSCNMIRFTDAGKIGYNTDVYGISGALLRHTDPHGAKVLILGTGGAARAAICAIAGFGGEITLWNRTLNRAEAAAELARQNLGINIRFTDNFDSLAGFDIIIQATPLGAGDLANISPIPNLELLTNCKFIIDMNYYPAKNKFLADAENAGIPASNGVEMLVLQAARAFEIWNNVDISKTDIDGAINYINSLRR